MHLTDLMCICNACSGHGPDQCRRYTGGSLELSRCVVAWEERCVVVVLDSKGQCGCGTIAQGICSNDSMTLRGAQTRPRYG